MYKIKFHKTWKPVYIDIFVVKWIFFFNIFINDFPKIHHSVLQGISPTLKYRPQSFLSRPSLLSTTRLQKKKKKIEKLRISLPPWNVLSSKKAETHSFEETKDFITNSEKEHF